MGLPIDPYQSWLDLGDDIADMYIHMAHRTLSTDSHPKSPPLPSWAAGFGRPLWLGEQQGACHGIGQYAARLGTAGLTRPADLCRFFDTTNCSGPASTTTCVLANGHRPSVWICCCTLLLLFQGAVPPFCNPALESGIHNWAMGCC